MGILRWILDASNMIPRELEDALNSNQGGIVDAIYSNDTSKIFEIDGKQYRIRDAKHWLKQQG